MGRLEVGQAGTVGSRAQGTTLKEREQGLARAPSTWKTWAQSGHVEGEGKEAEAHADKDQPKSKPARLLRCSGDGALVAKLCPTLAIPWTVA